MNHTAIVGHTGFVGSNLCAQHSFDEFYNSKNIENIAGHEFELLMVSAMPAAMWVANKDPDADRAVLDRLVAALKQVRAKMVVVMSTVAVYPAPVNVHEDSPIDDAIQTPYGKHRLLLERQLLDHFPKVLAVRLPGLFGPGLKKNAVYDLLHGNEAHKLDAGSVYQFYNLDRLWQDTSRARNAGLEVVNFATQPVSIAEVAREAFDLEFTNTTNAPTALFDMRSRNAALFGGHDGYLYDRQQVLDELRNFVARERAGRALT